MSLIVLKFLSPSYQKYVNLCREYESGENLACEKLMYFQNIQNNCVFFVG